MKEYIRIEEEKAHRRGKVYNWETAKYDSENDNEEVNMPSFPSLEPKVSCFDDLDFFKDFENEFLAIVYNDALTFKSDHLTKPTLSPQHMDEFNLKDETSLSEYDAVEQNVLYFNDLFHFNIIYPDNLKSDKDNDDNEIGIIQSSGHNVNTQGQKKIGLQEWIRRIRLVERSMIDQGRFSTWMISCMTQLMEASGSTDQAFDGTF
uniref:Uncharacterized protein n=1 Tax=Tanacetum cinerariifolium TaxID=118510 RepID=A0A699HDQ6_TANCI|nr:hypothetical protein [Tanacetum cinerariifolium]